jgi:serine phosphatase RsbU (regulator of sigma subunit)
VLRFDGGWAAIIGDVVGKGAEAAALTAVARHTLAAIVDSTGDLSYALQVLNRRLRRRSADDGGLCTVAAVLVSEEDGVAVLSAGHPLPLLRRGASVTAVGRPSPMLGFVDDVEISATAVEIGLGDQLILYTDGVLDAIGATERFGEHRLVETVRTLDDGNGNGDGRPADRILRVVDAYRNRDQVDDIAIMSITRSRVPVPGSR